MELETVFLPRDAFVGPKKSVKAGERVGRIAGEQVTPYPPGIPVLVAGERINAAVVDYVRSGLTAGIVIPDATDATLDTIVVVA